MEKLYLELRVVGTPYITDDVVILPAVLNCAIAISATFIKQKLQQYDPYSKLIFPFPRAIL